MKQLTSKINNSQINQLTRKINNTHINQLTSKHKMKLTSFTVLVILINVSVTCSNPIDIIEYY